MISPLRVGIPIPAQRPTVGGGYVFQAMIFEEILRRRQAHHPDPNIQYILLALTDDCASQWGLGDHEVLDLSPCFRQPPPTPLRQRLTRKARKLLGQGQHPIDSRPDVHRLLQESIDISWSLTHVPPSDQTPFVITIWDLQHRLQPFFPEVSRGGEWDARESTYSYFTKKAAFCVVGTERGKQELCHFYSVDAQRVIVNPFPCPPLVQSCLEPSRNDIHQLANMRYLLYPAQFWPHKNHLTLLNALLVVAQTHPDLKLVLTGSDQGCMASILQTIKHLDLSRQVICLGFVERTDLEYLYRHALGLVFPSFFGPDNLPPLEAISHGIPALVADVPGAREQYGDSVDYFDPFEPLSIAAAIENLILDNNPPESRAILRQELLNRLTPAAYIDHFEQIMYQYRFALYCSSFHESKDSSTR
jgi:glycosyltransferase involved in cell wall biosynthesis